MARRIGVACAATRPRRRVRSRPSVLPRSPRSATPRFLAGRRGSAARLAAAASRGRMPLAAAPGAVDGAALAASALLVMIVDPWAISEPGAWLSVIGLTGVVTALRWSDRAIGTTSLGAQRERIGRRRNFDGAGDGGGIRPGGPDRHRARSGGHAADAGDAPGGVRAADASWRGAGVGDRDRRVR